MQVAPNDPARRVAELERQLADERLRSAEKQRDLKRAAAQKQRQHDKELQEHLRFIDQLHARLRALQTQRFARSSEKHPGQAELQLFNEAEVAQKQAMTPAGSKSMATIVPNLNNKNIDTALASIQGADPDAIRGLFVMLACVQGWNGEVIQ